MNVGAFPLPVKDILGKIYSKLRNPTIAKLFRFVGIAENAGYGMNKLASWETLTGTRPTIESDRTIATVSVSDVRITPFTINLIEGFTIFVLPKSPSIAGCCRNVLCCCAWRINFYIM